MGVDVFPILNPLPPSSPSHPLGHPSAPSPEHLSHALNLDWKYVSHMIIYMFQWYSLRSSHPCFLPQRPKDCSIHLCLFCCLACRVIVTIFLIFKLFFKIYLTYSWGFSGGSEVKASAWNTGDLGLIPGSLPWRRKWQPTPVLLPGESHGRQSLVGCCLWGRTESDTNEVT